MTVPVVSWLFLVAAGAAGDVTIVVAAVIKQCGAFASVGFCWLLRLFWYLRKGYKILNYITENMFYVHNITILYPPVIPPPAMLDRVM